MYLQFYQNYRCGDREYNRTASYSIPNTLSTYIITWKNKDFPCWLSLCRSAYLYTKSKASSATSPQHNITHSLAPFDQSRDEKGPFKDSL